MLAVLSLVVGSLAGTSIITRAVPTVPAIVRLPAGFLLWIIASSLTTYAVASALAGRTTHALTIGIWISTMLAAAVLATVGRRLRPRDLTMPRLDAAVTAGALVISWWLEHAHLRRQGDELMISANTWSDMALHTAIARSFSVGANYGPTEYPFFAGEPIHYHFGVDFFAGMLQAGGMPVGWSFTLPGTLGFTAMLLVTFALTRLLVSPANPVRASRDRGVWAGLIAIALLLTNQSLAWRRYVEHDGHGSLLTALDPSVLWHHTGYLATGPYTDDRIAIFNTLNVYVAQTHLVIGMAIALTVAYLLIWLLRDGAQASTARLAGVGAAFGAMFWLNGVVWLATAVFATGLLALDALAAVRRARRDPDASTPHTIRAWVKIGAAFLIPAMLLGVPQALILSGGGSDDGISTQLGYLVCASTKASCHGGQMDPLSLRDWGAFLVYWWLNEGVFIPLLILAFILGTGRDRRIILAATGLFVWGSIFYVGGDIGGHNHKLFNLWENLTGPFVAFAVVRLWIAVGRRAGTRRLVRRTGRAGVAALTGLLVISGVVDAMTIKNDTMTGVFGDQTTRDATAWVVANTPRRAVFLTDYDQLYTVPSEAGRRIVLGYSPWVSSSGYEVEPRMRAVAAIYSAPDVATACQRMRARGVDYAIVGPQERTSSRFALNRAVFEAGLRAVATFGDGDAQLRIIRVATAC